MHEANDRNVSKCYESDPIQHTPSPEQWMGPPGASGPTGASGLPGRYGRDFYGCGTYRRPVSEETAN